MLRRRLGGELWRLSEVPNLREGVGWNCPLPHSSALSSFRRSA